MVRPPRTWFCETLTLPACLRAYLCQEKTWYCRQSLTMRVARRLFGLAMSPLFEPIRYGHLQRATGIRRRAYEYSLQQIAACPLPLSRLSPGFAADMDLLASKFLLEQLFSQYEFQGMAAQYANEHPELQCRLVLDAGRFPPLPFKEGRLQPSQRKRLDLLHYLAGILLAPFYLLYLMRANASREEPVFGGQVLCEVDSMRIVDMFNALLETEVAPVFMAQSHYLSNFSDAQAADLHPHRVGSHKRKRLRALLRAWLALGLRQAWPLSTGGLLYFDFFKTLAQGIVITPLARHCSYLTFEHLSSIKAVRNALLRATDNRSIFVPYNSYAIDHFFAPEYRYNYDLLCSPCPLLEEVYRRQGAATPAVVQTGAYSSHRQTAPDPLALQRQAGLARFKGDCMSVTILSAGLTVETISGERRLLALAQDLATREGVKVFIREKPAAPDPRFAQLYRGPLHDHPQIMVSGDEYQLFDFLPVTDLFITSISSSAVDLCAAGAQFYAVDFWHDRDLYLWQTAVQGVFLDEAHALSSILAWLHDAPPGTRAKHAERISELRELIAYRLPDFASYRERFLKQIKPWLSSPHRGLASNVAPEMPLLK